MDLNHIWIHILSCFCILSKQLQMSCHVLVFQCSLAIVGICYYWLFSLTNGVCRGCNSAVQKLLVISKIGKILLFSNRPFQLSIFIYYLRIYKKAKIELTFNILFFTHFCIFGTEWTKVVAATDNSSSNTKVFIPISISTQLLVTSITITFWKQKKI